MNERCDLDHESFRRRTMSSIDSSTEYWSWVRIDHYSGGLVVSTRWEEDEWKCLHPSQGMC